MKTLSVCALGLFLSISAMAVSPAFVKTCSTELKGLNGSKVIPTTLEVSSKGGSLRAKVTQTVDGKTDSYEDTAEIFEHKVRANLASVSSADLDDEDLQLNLAEVLIAHAMALTADPEMAPFFSAGLDLKAIRSAKIYMIGQPTSMGMTAIVEAKNESGKNMGSFLGGFLVSPCK